MCINEGSHAEKHVSIDPLSIKPPILPLLPTNYKFLSTSLPNSPRVGGSPVARSRASDHTRLHRSKSGGDHRASAPYGGFDLWAALNNTGEQKSSKKNGNDNSQKERKVGNEIRNPNEIDFKCGALCLFLPGFGKGKPVRSAKRPEQGVRSYVISQRISLEKFECGSWRSSAIHSDIDDYSSTLYFDLPLELIRTSVSDTALPMNSAFVFNKGSVKGVLKTTGGSVERKSHEGRHVRFSTNSSTTTQPTSPSCISPRLRKARDDFNAFLEAQSA